MKTRLQRIRKRVAAARSEGGWRAVGRMTRRYLWWRLRGRPVKPPPPPRLPRGIPEVSEWVLWNKDIQPTGLVDAEPLFSVVCPVYNTPVGLLEAAVESVVNQTYARWELLLVDDASSDERTLSALADLAATDDRIRVIRNEKNLGISLTTNRGIELAAGEYVIFMDHDDLLLETALEWCAVCAPEADLIYSDEDKIDADGSLHSRVMKPSWSPRLLLDFNYLNHLTCVRTDLLRAVGGLRVGFEGAQDHELLLRLSELPLTVAHLPNILYHWRVWEGSTSASASAKPEAERAGLTAVAEAIARRDWNADADLATGDPFKYRVVFRPDPEPELIKVVIPTRDRVELLSEAVNGVLARTDGVPVHLVIVDNGSREEATHRFLEDLAARPNVTVVRHDDAFNFSRLCNIGAQAGPDTRQLLLLNNDIRVLHRNWLLQLSGWLREREVVAAGPKLLFPDGTIQHAGVIMGIGGIAGHYSLRLPDMPRLGDLHDSAREVACLTAACLLVKTAAYDAVGGMDEVFRVDFQDVDFCMRLRHDLGGVLMYDPTYPLTHQESATRERTGASNLYTLSRMHLKWSDVIRDGDPAYNPHLALNRHDHALAPLPRARQDRLRRLMPRWTVTPGSQTAQL